MLNKMNYIAPQTVYF